MLRYTAVLMAAALVCAASAAPTLTLVGSPNQAVTEGNAFSLDVTSIISAISDGSTATNDLVISAASTGTPSLSFAGCNGGTYGNGCTIVGSGTGNVVTAGNAGTFNVTLNVTNAASQSTTATFVVAVYAGASAAFSSVDSAAGTGTLTVSFTSAVTSGFANDDLTMSGANCTAVSSTDSGFTYTSTCTADGTAGSVSVTVGDDTASGFKGAAAVTFSYAPTVTAVAVVNGSDAALVGPDGNIARGASIKVTYTFSGAVSGFTTGSLTSTQADKAGTTISAAPTVSSATASGNNWVFAVSLGNSAVTTTFVLTLSDGGVTATMANGVSNSMAVIYDQAAPTINLGTGPFYLTDGAVTDELVIGAGKIITSISDDAVPNNDASLKVKIVVSGGVSGRVVSTCSATLTASAATACKLQGSGTGNMIPNDSHGNYTLTIDAQDTAGNSATQATVTVYVRATIQNGDGVGKATKVLTAPFNYPVSGFTSVVEDTFDRVCNSTGGASDIAVAVSVSDTAGSQAANCQVLNGGNKQGATAKPGLKCEFDAAGTVAIAITCSNQFTAGDNDAVDVPNTVTGSWAITENTAPTPSVSGSFAYTENGVARKLGDDLTFAVTDTTDSQLSKAVLRRTNCPPGTRDRLGVSLPLPATISHNVAADFCALTLTPSAGATAGASITDFVSALNRVTFLHTSDNPDSKAVTMELVVSDNAGGVTPPKRWDGLNPDPYYYLNKTVAFNFTIVEVNDDLGYAMKEQNSNFTLYSGLETTQVRITENPADGDCLKDANGKDVELIIEDVDAMTQARRLAAEGPKESHIALEIVADSTMPSDKFWSLKRTMGPNASATSQTNSTLAPGNEERFVFEKFKVCVAGKGKAVTEGGPIRPSESNIDYENVPPTQWSGMTPDKKLKLRFKATSEANANARFFDIWYAVSNVAVEAPQWHHPTAGTVTNGRRGADATGLVNPRTFYRSALKASFTYKAENLDAATGNIIADNVKFDFYPEADIEWNATVAPIDFVHGQPNVVAYPLSSFVFLEGGAVPRFSLKVLGEVTKDLAAAAKTAVPAITQETLLSTNTTTMGNVFSSTEALRFKFEANSTHVTFFGTPTYGDNNGTISLQNTSAFRKSPKARRFKFELTATHPTDSTKTSTRQLFIDVEIRGCMDVRGSYSNSSSFLKNDLTTLPTAAERSSYDTANWKNLNGNFNDEATIPSLCTFPPKAIAKGQAGSLTVPGARSETSAAALVAALGSNPSANDLEAARGYVGIDVPSGATTREVALEVGGVTEDIALAIPPPKDGAVVDADLSVKLGPCGEQFDQPIEICVFVGSVAPSRFMTMYHSSSVSCDDPSLGYAEFQPTTGNSFDPVTGKLCGKVSSFSIVSAVSLPVPASDQLEARFFNMGGGCPSDCSGHGYCRAYGKCFCFEGYSGFDCAKRSCPSGESWAANSEVTRQTAECSGRGECDTSSGQCQCFDGFEGPRCERMRCENRCSGHGKCRYISERSSSVSWSEWDKSRIQSCECDPGYFGSDCSLRYCPFGDDPQTHCSADASSRQSVTIKVPATPTQAGSTNYPAAPASLSASPNQAWTIKGGSIVVDFTDAMLNKYTTSPVHDIFATSGAKTDGQLSSAMLSAVKGLPNFIVDSGLTITASSASSNVADRTVMFEMTGDANGGDAIAVTCPAQYGCPWYGCRPRWEQPHLMAMSRASTEVQPADPLHIEPDSGRDGVAIKVVVAGASGARTFAASACPITVSSTGVPTEGSCATIFSARPVPSTAKTAKKPTQISNGFALTFTTNNPTVGNYDFYYIVGSCSSSIVRRSGDAREGIECAGRGVCDRSTGLCDCFDGYQGFNCAARSITI